MRIKLSVLRKFIREAIETVAKESHSRVKRNKHGYTDSLFDESLDSRTRRRSYIT
jgi:hypothetical protein